MKRAIIILCFLAGYLAAQAQGIYNDGARIVSQSGTSWVVSGGTFTLTSTSATDLASLANLKIESGATLTLGSASFLTIGGSFVNSGTLSGTTSSTVTFANSTAQAITGSGTSTFGNLTLDNNGGLTLTNAGITVNGTLNLTNGILTTGIYAATIGTSGSITNNSSTKYVNGKLAQTFSSTGSKVFPIGKGGNYRPVTFNYAALTGTSVVTAEQFESGMSGTFPSNTTLLTTNRYWTLSQTGGSAFQYFVTLDATGYSTSNPVVLLKKEAGTITSQASTTPNYTNTTALTSLGDFALAGYVEAPGNALAFDGVDDYVQISNPYRGFTNSITVELWAEINMADCPAAGGFLGQSVSGSDQMSTNVWIMEIIKANNTLYFYVNDNGTWRSVSTSGNFPASGWHHWVATSNSTSTNLYLDGTLINSSAGISSGIRNSPSSVIHIGKEVRYSLARFIQCSIDEVRIWNTAKTQSELQSNMYSELAGTESGLVAYYNFNQGVAGGDNTGINTLNDLTSNANNGTLTNLTKTGTTSNFVESYALVVPVPAAATNLTGTSFTANWTAPGVGTVTSYLLDVSTSSTFSSFVPGYEGLDCGISLSKAVSGLTAGSAYYYRVRADKTSVTGAGGYYRTPITVTTSCANPTDGGAIAADQTVCSPFDPAEITSSTLPTGHTGTLEYKWQRSTSADFSSPADINSNAANYDPPSGLTVDTWYRRLARVTCSANWTGAAISNAVKMTVTPVSVGGIVKW